MSLVQPKYDEALKLREQIKSYNANLETADKLKESREALIASYNDIPKTDLDNLKTLLPDSVDNIRLIIQIDALATKNGLSTVRNVEYQTNEIKPGSAATTTTGQSPEAAKRSYGEFVIGFTTTGQYQNFLSFLSDLEANLRLVDITKVEFTPISVGGQSTVTSMGYKVALKTYWLKQ